MKLPFLAAGLMVATACTAARGDDFYVSTLNDGALTRISGEKAVAIATGDQPFWGLAVDRDGCLYAANVGANCILKYAPSRGPLPPNPTVFTTGLHAPLALAFDRSGNLFESERGGNIYEFPHVGAALSSQRVLFIDGSAPQANLLGPRQPDDLAFDLRGNLYVAIEIGGILRFSETAAGVSRLPDAQPFSTVSRAREMAFDKEGNLFTANHLAGEWSVYKFLNTQGGLSNTPQIFAQGHGLDGPHGVTFDSAGSLYVTNWGGGNGTQILRYPVVKGRLSDTPTVWGAGFHSPVLIVAVKVPK